MKNIIIMGLLAFLAGCSSLYLSTKPLPHSSKINSITLYALSNYTDTPQAGLRASNLIEGALLDNNYTVVNDISNVVLTLPQQIQQGKDNGSSHILVGGISEWRYKTGIDGEPAISFNCKLISLDTSMVVWNATASSNDWGNASLGTTAQAMIESIFARD